MKTMVDQVLSQTSPAELGYIKEGDLDTAEWIVKKAIPGLTETQIESVAFSVQETVIK